MKRERRLLRIVARRLVCVRRSTVPTVVAIAIAALFLSGCASSRKSVIQASVSQASLIRHAVDSAVSVSESWQSPVKVPAAAVRLEVNPDSLAQLPPGASYTARQGRARVSVMRRPATSKHPATLIVEANCDSLELVCARYAKTVSTLRRQLSATSQSASAHQESEKVRSLSLLKAIKYSFMIAVLLGIIWIVLTQQKKRK